jgi:kynurenine formamidase
MAWMPPTQAEVDGYFAKLNNWGRWGPDDRLGTLNLITPEKRQAAMQLGQKGRVVSLAQDIKPHANLDYQMLFPGWRDGCDVAMDYFGMVFHGTAFTHIDALCHVSYEGKLYNNRPFEENLSGTGAEWGSLDAWFEGIVTRGVLLDVAAGRAEGYVSEGNPVTPADLDAAAKRSGVSVEAGDVVVVRSGRAVYEETHGPYGAGPRPGLHIACMTWLRHHDVAVIAWDMHDERPVGYGDMEFGVHLAIPLLGLCLIDNTYPERLVAACAAEGRYEFLFTAMPLRLVGGTGCPVNPLAIL